jgi:hypothetical protein
MYEYLNLLREQVVCPGKNQRNNSGGCLHLSDIFKLISDGSDSVCSSTNLAIVRLILMALKKDYTIWKETNMENFRTTVMDQKKDSPVIHRESNGVKITITFAEKTGEGSVKDTILDMLTNAYEKRIRE